MDTRGSCPQWIARSLFERWSFQVSSSQHHCCRDVSKLAADGNFSLFAASCISCFWISLPLLCFMCMADLVHLSFPQWGKCEGCTAMRLRVTAHGRRRQSDLSWVLQISAVISVYGATSQNGSQGGDCSPLRATQWGAVPGWHPKLRQFGFSPGHLFTDLWEAQLGEVLRGFLPCRGSTNQSHITNRWLFNTFSTNNQWRKFSCLSWAICY